VSEALGPYRAALTQGRRRSIVFLFLVAMGIFGAVAWSSFRPLQTQRSFLDQLESGHITPENFFRYAPGITCGGGPEPLGPGVEPGGSPSEASPSATASTTPAGPEATAGGSGSPLPVKPTRPGGPESRATCQVIGPGGEPIGPPLPGDAFSTPEGPSQSFIDQITPQLIDAQRQVIATTESLLTMRALFEIRVRALGTFLGILFIVFFASTFFGAESRWSVWRTLLTHEPRRGRILASKFGALWTFVLAGLVVALGISVAVDVAMRVVLNVNATGGPSIAGLAKQTGWAALTLTTSATIAASLALMVRTSIAGMGAFLVLLGDHLLVQRFLWLREYSSTTQVASLLPEPATISTGYVWFPHVTHSIECTRAAGASFPECTEVLLKPLSHWHAGVVLAAWLVAFLLAAWALFRVRDVPQ